MQFQRIIAHPRHFADKITNPILGVILSSAVKADRTLLCIGSICSLKALNRMAARITEMFVKSVHSINQAVHITGANLRIGGNIQLVAFRRDATIRIHTNDNISIRNPSLRSPCNCQRGRNRQTICSKLTLDQLNGLQ